MRFKRTAVMITVAFVGSGAGKDVQAQGVFLNLPSSAATNGMGGVAASFASDNATSTIANPAQLGLFSLHGELNASKGLSAWLESNAQLDASAINLGADLNRFWRNLPVKLSAGIGYSNLTYVPNYFGIEPLDLGSQISTGNEMTFGIGLDYFVKLGLGFSLDWVNLESPYYYYSQKSSLFSNDYGALLQVPVTDILSKLENHTVLINHNVTPDLNVTFAYSRKNNGNYNYYFPTATLGFNFQVGLSSRVSDFSWRWVSFAWAREANDYLSGIDSTLGVTNPDTFYSYSAVYRQGPSRLQPWQNLILGRGGVVGIRKGWQLGLGEFLYIRGGSIIEVDEPTYTTYGWGVSLDGIVKFLVFFKDINPNGGVERFLLHHLDLQFDHSGFSNGTSLDALNVVYR